MAKKDPNAPKGKPGRPHGSTALSNPAIKAIRVQDMVSMRARGYSVPEVAAKYRTSVASVYRLLKWAETEGLMGELKEKALRDLGQITIDAYKGALTVPLNSPQSALEAHKVRLTAAKDVAFGTGILSKKTETHSVQETHSMEWFLEQRAQKSEQTADEEVLEGHVTVSPEHELAEEAPESLEPGDGENGFPEQGDPGGDSISGDSSLGGREEGDESE